MVEKTDSKKYFKRLSDLQGMPWKRWLNVQLPYRWNLKRVALGVTLDVGCGIGRNLQNLAGFGVGVDHNKFCVEEANRNGYRAFLPNEFVTWAADNHFQADNLLFSHVLEHMTELEALDLIKANLKYLKTSGKIILMTPQEKGYKSDLTHITYMDFALLGDMARSVGFQVEKAYSFPFPRWLGKFFLYNEFVSIWTKTGRE